MPLLGSRKYFGPQSEGERRGKKGKGEKERPNEWWPRLEHKVASHKKKNEKNEKNKKKQGTAGIEPTVRGIGGLLVTLPSNGGGSGGGIVKKALTRQWPSAVRPHCA